MFTSRILTEHGPLFIRYLYNADHDADPDVNDLEVMLGASRIFTHKTLGGIDYGDIAVFPFVDASGALKLFVWRSNSTLEVITVSIPSGSATYSGQMELVGTIDIGSPCRTYHDPLNLYQSFRDSSMFHDDDSVYTMAAQYVDDPDDPGSLMIRSYSLTRYGQDGSMTTSTPIVPAICETAITDTAISWMELTYFGSSKYVCVVRSNVSPKNTLGVYVGSPWVGWEEILPDYRRGAVVDPILATGEYLHVEPVHYDPGTGALYLEGTLKQTEGVDTGAYRFALFKRSSAVAGTRWTMIGKARNITLTGVKSMALASYGRYAQSGKQVRNSTRFGFVEFYANPLLG